MATSGGGQFQIRLRKIHIILDTIHFMLIPMILL